MAWAAAIPAAISLGSSLFGRKKSGGDINQISTVSPMQQQFLDMILGNLMQNGGAGLDINKNPLYQGGQKSLMELLSDDPAAFDAYEAPFKRQFNQEVIPGIAERFTAAGGGRSSGLNNALATAGREMTGDLARQRSMLKMNALSQALGYAQQPIANSQSLAGLAIGKPMTENIYKPRQNSWLESVLGNKDVTSSLTDLISMIGG